MSRGRILVIRGGAIGDFILTLPVLSALRRQFPPAHLEVLGYTHIAQLAQAGGLVDGVRAIEARGLASFFAAGGVLDDDFREYFSEFDLIISYLFDPDDVFKTNVALCTQAQFIQGPHRPKDAAPQHATEILLKPLERLAIFDADPIPRLNLSNFRSRSDRLVIHPGSGSERKNWPETRWAELLRTLIEHTRFSLLLVGGEAEGERLERLAASLPNDRLATARSRPLTELANLMFGGIGFLGHDSGITHLAAALGLPCVVLWADTNPAVWQPRGPHVSLLRDTAGLAEVTVDRVTAAIALLSRRA
jgi:ADP-heptose:LPS heptosyltransferase